MNKKTGLLFLALAAASLAGCGLKGPLYFPKDEPVKSKTTTTPATQPDTQVTSPASTSGQTNPAG